MMRQIYQSDGLPALLGEVAYQVLRPVFRAHTAAVWKWHQRRRSLCFHIAGNQLRVLPADQGISVELAVHRTHEPTAARLLASCLRPGMIVVDVGANIGYYALLEARLVGPRGRVLAIEPVPENARMFLHNLQANGYENVAFRQVAISNRNGMSKMHVSARSNHHSLHDVPWQTADLDVPVCTLDALLKDEVLSSLDVIRMDLEGHEIAVLDGMTATIEKYHPRLLVEVHPHIVGPDATIRYLDRLNLLGYSVDWVIDQERDVPWRSRFLKPEQLSIEDLLSDWRIQTHPRALTVMFQHETAAPLASVDGEYSVARR